MDYNYVRMRNAASRGDIELTAKYRKLYERGKSRTDSHMLDWLIALLLVVAIALGIYISSVGNKKTIVQEEPKTVEEQPDEPVEQPDYVTKPDEGAGAGTGTANEENLQN